MRSWDVMEATVLLVDAGAASILAFFFSCSRLRVEPHTEAHQATDERTPLDVFAQTLWYHLLHANLGQRSSPADS